MTTMANPKTAKPVSIDGKTLELLANAEANARRQEQRRAMWNVPPSDPIADILGSMCKACRGFGCDCATRGDRGR
jgi:hypothetical protein